MRPSLLIVADGESVHTRRLAAAVADRNWDVHLASFEGPTIHGVRRHHLGSRPPSQDARYALAIPPLAGLIRRIRPEVVNAHYVTSYGVMARAAMILSRASRSRSALVISAWGSDLLVTSRSNVAMSGLTGWALRGADLITGDSVDLCARAAELAPQKAWHSFMFGPERHLIEATRSPGNLIVSARSLTRGMRVDLVIRAFRASRSLAPQVMSGYRLVIAGDGPEREALAGDALDLPVDFVGQLDRRDLHGVLLRSRMHVSVPVSDATSAALLDGMASGLIPVVNDLPANRQWVDQALGEIVSRDPSVHELASAFVRAASRAISVDAIRDRVKEVVWEDQVDRLLSRLVLLHSTPSD